MLPVIRLCVSLSILSTASCEYLSKPEFLDAGFMQEAILCVQIIADEYLTRKNELLIVSGGSFITGEILRRIQPDFAVNLADKNSRIDFTDVCDFIVIDDQSMRDSYEAVENMAINPRGRYVIVTRGEQEVLATAAARFWRSGIADVIFVQVSKGGTVRVFGYEISSGYQNSTRLYVLDSCGEGRFGKGSNLFPPKLKDMNKYPLKVTVLNTRQMEPEIYVSRDDGGKLKINGVGSTLLNLFAEKLNFSVSVRENVYYGHKDKDGTWTGPPGQLMRGEADLSFAGILPTTRVTRDFEHSDFYRWDALHFAMKIRGRTVSWKSVFKPLSTAVWICQFLVLVTTLWLVCIVKKFRYLNILKECIRHIDVLRVLFGQSVRYPKHTGIRLAFALWLIYAYLTTASYTGSLVTYLSMPSYQKNPNTLEELEKSSLEIAGPVPIKILLGETGDPVERKIHDRFVNLTYESFWQVLSDKDRAVALYRTSVIIHNWRTRLNESMSIHIIEDPIFTFPLFYYMRKGHPYREPLNQFIRQIQSSGLVTKWLNDFNARNTERKTQQESVVLTLDHLACVFLILICGCVVSTVRFVYELYIRDG